MTFNQSKELCFNFAKQDGRTKANMEKVVIPRLQRELEEVKKIILELRSPGPGGRARKNYVFYLLEDQREIQRCLRAAYSRLETSQKMAVVSRRAGRVRPGRTENPWHFWQILRPFYNFPIPSNLK